MDDISTKKDAVIDELISTLIFTGIMTAIGGTGAGIITMLIKNSLNSEDTKQVENTVAKLIPTLKKVYSERPNELITVAMNIGNIFQNHDSDLIVAHMKAQDSYYIDAYNRDPAHIAKINAVPLRDNADFARAVFGTYNTVKLYLNSKNDANLKVNVEGFTLGLSKVHQCNSGYAVGYYSYATSEKMELFFNVDDKFIIEYESFSKKFWKHEVSYDLYYQHSSLGAENGISKKIYHQSQEVRLGAGPYTHNPGKTPRQMAGY